jgi:hypothetical protein
MAITFQVSRVPRSTAPLKMPAAGGRLCLHRQPVEAMGASASPFLPAEEHGLLRAVHMAYAVHYPLALSPDAIWLAIAQGFAMHVNANAERLRGKFMRRAGQETIIIKRDDFVKGSPENPWPEVWSAFSDAVAAHIGRQRDLVVADFSTTGACERAASEIVLMDSMQCYFKYVVQTSCGIPEITLEGTADDWRSIRRRAQALEEYDLGWWTDALGPVLDQLVATAEGRVDVPFWETLFKHVDGSGGPWVCGWINVLFPYLRRGEGGELVRNDRMADWKKGISDRSGGGPSPADIPSGISSVPFVWDYLGQKLPMRFLGGFVGVAQDAGALAVRPAIGWAVRDEMAAAPGREAVRSRVFLGHVALLAGRISGTVSLTEEEIVALLERIRRAGFGITCMAVGDLSGIGDFAEAPLPCRIAVGMVIRSIDLGRSGHVVIGTEEIQRALDAMRDAPQVLWRAIESFVPGGLGDAPGVHLVVAGLIWTGELRFGSQDGRHVPVAVVAARDACSAVIDVTPEGHGARLDAVGERGVKPEDAAYLLRAGVDRRS